jgi:hypothetical protein
MLKILYFILLIQLSTHFCYSQDTLRYDDLQLDYKHTHLKGNQTFKVYIDKFGNKISENTELTLGKNSNLVTGKYQTWGIRQLGVYTPVDKIMSGEKVLVKRIFIIRIGLGMNTSFILTMDCELISKRLSKNTLTVQYFEKSIENGETIFDSGILTKEKALKVLKEKKELLDLDLINQSEYDSLKKALSPIILKN